MEENLILKPIPRPLPVAAVRKIVTPNDHPTVAKWLQASTESGTPEMLHGRLPLGTPGSRQVTCEALQGRARWQAGEPSLWAP